MAVKYTIINKTFLFILNQNNKTLFLKKSSKIYINIKNSINYF
jgi:hypothetical protein